MQNISEKINEYLQDPRYPFHMPGHKRSEGRHDFTEIDGFDVLSHPIGIVAESQRRAAALFGADKTYYLINGSTVGILAGILAAADPDKCVLLGPDCHKAVYHAQELGRLEAVDADGKPAAGTDSRAAANAEQEVDLHASALTSLADIERELDWDALPTRIERTLEDKGGAVSLVVITSPTYEGVISDIARIAEIAHRYGALLMVDEAHGAHLGMHPAFGENSNRLGADLVVHSMHKTMTGLTQTALLHVNGGAVDKARIEHYLEMLQTSSPSYLLMESMDRCIAQLSVDKDSSFGDYAGRLEHFRGKLENLSYISLFRTEHFDPGKLVLTVKDNDAGFTAPMMYAVLRDKYGLQLEFAQDEYALAMTSFVDTDEAFDRLYEALDGIDEALAAGKDPADMHTAIANTEKDTAGAAGAQREPSSGNASVIRKTDCYQDHTP